MKFSIITMDQRRLRDTLDEIEKQTCKKMKTSSVGCGTGTDTVYQKKKKKKERNTEQRLCRDIDVRTDFTDFWYNLVTMSDPKQSLDLRRLRLFLKVGRCFFAWRKW